MKVIFKSMSIKDTVQGSCANNDESHLDFGRRIES